MSGEGEQKPCSISVSAGGYTCVYYPDSSLANLYDELTMSPELRTAHQKNDRAVMEAYGMSVKDTTESSCVVDQMKHYQELVG